MIKYLIVAVIVAVLCFASVDNTRAGWWDWDSDSSSSNDNSQGNNSQSSLDSMLSNFFSELESWFNGSSSSSSSGSSSSSSSGSSGSSSSGSSSSASATITNQLNQDLTAIQTDSQNLNQAISNGDFSQATTQQNQLNANRKTYYNNVGQAATTSGGTVSIAAPMVVPVTAQGKY